MDKSYLELYLEYKDNMAALTTDNQFYENMVDIVERGKTSYSLFNRFFEKKIDMTWVEEIEACIIPLDNIIRVPRKFIVQEEEIVPIERAKKITAESVRHLAQHTNMIAKVEGDDVTPNEILNVFREESFEVYENRFVYTLMQNLIRFIDIRYNVLFNLSDDENMASLKMETESYRGNEKIIYKLEVSAQSGGNDVGDTAMIEGEHATAFQRIERIKRIINEYAHSGFMKELQGCVPVRPPIMRTNAIQKNPNFRACLKLWQFIQSYRDVGYEIISKESNEMVSDEYRLELNRLIAANYMLLKNNTISEDALGRKAKQRKVKPKLLKRLAEELVLDYDMEEVEIKRIFVDEVKRLSKRKLAGEKRVKDAIDRALASENARKKTAFFSCQILKRNIKIREASVFFIPVHYTYCFFFYSQTFLIPFRESFVALHLLRIRHDSGSVHSGKNSLVQIFFQRHSFSVCQERGKESNSPGSSLIRRIHNSNRSIDRSGQVSLRNPLRLEKSAVPGKSVYFHFLIFHQDIHA